MDCLSCIHFEVCDAHRKHNGIGMKICGLYKDTKRFLILPDLSGLREKILKAQNEINKIRGLMDIEHLESEIYKIENILDDKEDKK